MQISVRKRLSAVVGLMALLCAPQSARAENREVPYWASISASRAHMRTGPGRNFPASWLYRRVGLPVRVVEIYENWRRIEDPDGTRGWMLVNLLSAERTAIVRQQVASLHERASDNSRIAYRVEAGVSGSLRGCGNGWCELDVEGRRGFIRTRYLWGVDSNEALR